MDNNEDTIKDFQEFKDKFEILLSERDEILREYKKELENETAKEMAEKIKKSLKS